MAQKIITALRPFEAEQVIYVYEDGNKIDLTKTTMKDFSKTVFALVDKYKIYDLELLGSKRYSEGIKKQILKDELTKYNENKLKITVR